jgi:hypothetical protein
MTEDTRPHVVIVDYMTNIWKPGASTDNRYDQIEEFAQQIKNIVNKLPFAVIFGAQLHSESKRGKNADLDSMLLMGGSLLRVATQAVEVVAFKSLKASAIIVHKARRTLMKTYSLKFTKGKLELMTTDEEATFIANLKKMGRSIKGLTDPESEAKRSQNAFSYAEEKVTSNE